MKYFVIVKYLDKASQQRWVEFDNRVSASEYAEAKGAESHIESARVARLV